jgi:hypothetical protein
LRFLGLILENIFMLFWGSSCRETAKNAIKQIDRKRRQEKSFFSLNFFGQKPKVFDMDFPQKGFYGVFELPLLGNAQKRHKKTTKIKKKKCTYLPYLVAICQIYVAFNFFLRRPLGVWCCVYVRGAAKKKPTGPQVHLLNTKSQTHPPTHRLFFVCVSSLCKETTPFRGGGSAAARQRAQLARMHCKPYQPVQEALLSVRSCFYCFSC